MAEDRNDGEGPRPYELLQTREIGSYEMFGVREDRVRSPKSGETRTVHSAVSPGGVCIVAVTDGGEVVMVEQWRHGSRTMSLECPAGVVDDGEDPAHAAARELREETGFEGEAAEILGFIDQNPSWQSSPLHLALVRGARRTREQDEDPGEDIRVRLVPAAEVRRKVLAGEVNAGPTVNALALWEWRAGGVDGSAG